MLTRSCELLIEAFTEFFIAFFDRDNISWNFTDCYYDVFDDSVDCYAFSESRGVVKQSSNTDQ